MKEIETTDYTPRLNLVVFILAAAGIAASFFPGWHLWGLDSPKYFPVWIRFLFLGLLLILSIPKVNSQIDQTLSDLLKSPGKSGLNGVYATLSLILVSLFIIFTSHNHFLGDGYNILGNIRQGRAFSLTEPFDYLLHQTIFQALGASEKAAYWSYAYSSYVCGALLLLGLCFFIKNKTQLLLSLALLSCFACLQFFFGYVENYSFSFVFMLFYSLSAIQDLKKRRLSSATVIFLCLACVFEVSCVVLVPSALFLATIRSSTRQKRKVLIAAAAIGVLASVVFLIISGKSGTGGIVVPLLKLPDNPYALFSSQHLKDSANLILLNYPLLLAIIILGNLRRRIAAPFYLFLIVPGLLFTLLVDPKLGAFRDWDLLSISSAPMLAFLIYALMPENGKKGRGAYALFLTLGLFGILHTGGWVIQNSSFERSYPIVKEAVQEDIHYSRYYLSGLRNMSWANVAAQYGKDINEVKRASLERNAGDPYDTLNVCELGNLLLLTGDTAQAIEITLKSWPRFLRNMQAISSLNQIMVRAGHYKDAERIAYNNLSARGEDADIYFDLGLIKQFLDQKDSSFFYFDKAYMKNPDMPIEEQFRLYLDCFRNSHDKMAIAGFTRLMTKLPPDPKRMAVYIVKTLNEGTPAKIDSVRNVAIRGVQ